MANRLIPKRSSVASSVPAVGDLVQGEIALNTTDKKLYFKDTANAIQELTGGGGGSGLPSEAGHKGKTITNKGVAGDSYWSPFVSSPNTVSADFTIETDTSASIVSPTIVDGVTVTIPVGSTLVIL